MTVYYIILKEQSILFLYLQILFLNVYSYYQDIKVRITLKGDKMAYINEINTDDLNYFRNRIINRMRELNINSTRALERV